MPRMQKNQIYYPRTYRRFQSDYKNQLLFLLICVLPSLILLLCFFPQLTNLLSRATQGCLSIVMPAEGLGIQYGEYIPFIGGVYFVSLPSNTPSFSLCMINLLVSFGLLWFCFTSKRKGKPLSIYFSIMLLIHVVSCIYFALASQYFPYTITQYSELYIKQQVGIWLSFVVIAGFVTGFMNNGTLLARCLTFFGIMGYSLVFGSVRYLALLYLLSAASSLYMPVVFFALGPFFDFLYLVFFYGLFVEHVIRRVNTGERRAVWKWF